MKKLPGLILTLLFVSPAFAMDADEIAQKANNAAYYQGNDGKATVSMTITDSQGRKRIRKLTILRYDVVDENKDTGVQKFYVYFTRPADVNKTAFIVHKYPGKEDDRWLYLPALDLVKRIAAGDNRTSFVGSTFFYEDVSGRSPEDDKHELMETTDNYYVVKNVPKKPGDVEFTYYKVWVHKTSFIPVKTEYYDAKGKVYRTYTAVKVEKVDGFATVMQSTMEDKRLGTKTLMSYSDVKYNVGLLENIFTERYLRKPPRKYLK